MMVTTVSLLLDLVLLGLLVYFFVMGVRRGLILSLCSLLAVLLALLGGWYLATHWSQPLEDRLEPVILESLLNKEENGQPDPSATQENGITLPEGFSQSLQEQVNQSAEAWRTANLNEAANLIAGLLAKAILFLIGFFRSTAGVEPPLPWIKLGGQTPWPAFPQQTTGRRVRPGQRHFGADHRPLGSL